uniref:Putative Ty1-copia subclass retrotransposon protein n=1 Tax=Ustilago esculenta TaxID=185366 RepID=A0A481SH62_9BASI|nr:putative Ty1-copia subclass retrotransposon protein [Ustilago esculenta]
MSTKLSMMVDHYPTVHQIWQHLEKSFSTKLRYRLEEIKTEFNSLRQDKLTIMSYAAKIEQSFAIRDANGKIRPVTIIKDKIDEKVKYDDIVDQLKAEEIKLGLHEEGDETVMITDVMNPKSAYSSSKNSYGSANNWIIDSASTVHICINKNLFTKLSETATPPIQSGSLQHMPACGKGTVKVVANIGHKKTHTLVLKNVFFVPTYAANLISLNLVAKVASISINGSRLIVRKGGNIIFKGETRNMLTYLCQPKPEFAALTYGAVSTSIWHQQLGYPGKGRMKQILEVIPEVAKETDMSSGKCHVCEVRKSHRQPFPNHMTTMTTEPLQLIHSDIVGKFKDIMPGGHQFAVTFINDYSRFVMVYLMTHKSEVLGHFQETRAILSSRNATFDEELFPFKEQDTPQIENTTTIDIHDEAPQEPVLIHPTPIRAISPDIVHPPSNNRPTFAQEEEHVGFPYLTQEERDQGISTPPLEDFICSLSSVAINNTKGTFTDEACANEGTPFPASDDEPRTILQAQCQPDWPKWQEAIQKELNSHQENNTWTVVNAPNNANIIGCRWVFKVKRKGDGTINKYKARLVAQGYTQVHGINYKETFTPVVKMATLRMLMIMSLQYDMKIYQLNVVTAYLNGELDVNLYMRQPPLPTSMIQSGSQSLVCKLNKSLYGLKQAGCTWYQKADSTLTNIGFKQSNYDSTLYYIENKGEPPLILTLSVDDVLIFVRHKPTADKFISTLQSKFKMTGGDPVLFILGIQVTSTPMSLHLSQTSHIQHLLTQFGLNNANIVHTPAIVNIAFAVNCLSHYLASPTDKAMTAVKHLLCYLKGTAN